MGFNSGFKGLMDTLNNWGFNWFENIYIKCVYKTEIKPKNYLY